MNVNGLFTAPASVGSWCCNSICNKQSICFHNWWIYVEYIKCHKMARVGIRTWSSNRVVFYISMEMCVDIPRSASLSTALSSVILSLNINGIRIYFIVKLLMLNIVRIECAQHSQCKHLLLITKWCPRLPGCPQSPVKLLKLYAKKSNSNHVPVSSFFFFTMFVGVLQA